MVINLPKSVFMQYHSKKDFSAFYPRDGSKNGGRRYEAKLRQ